MNRVDIDKVLNAAEMGMWVIEIDNNKKPRLFPSDIMLNLLGIEKEYNLTYEEIYEYWFSKIDHKEVYKVFQAIELLQTEKEIEVEYNWYHPLLGKRYVRCGGTKDENYKDGLRVLGYHMDITEKMKMKFHKDDKHVVVDQYKFNLYSSYFIDVYDELFEINLSNLTIKTIFYLPTLYTPFEDETPVYDVLTSRVHKDDIYKFKYALDVKNLTDMIQNSEIIRMDCRIKTINDEYIWVRVVCFPVMLRDKVNLLCYTYNIQNLKMVEALTKEKEEIMSAFIDKESSIVDINLTTRKVKIFLNNNSEIDNYIEADYDVFLNGFLNEYVEKEDHDEMLEVFDIENLKNVIKRKKNVYVDLQLNMKKFNYKWARISTILIENEEERIFLFIKTNNKDYVLQGVMEKLIIKNFDSLHYVDLKNNRYLLLYINENIIESLAYNEQSLDFYRDLNKFINKYIVIEEQEMFRYRLSKNNILESLEDTGIYTFSVGIVDDNNVYSRKRIDIQYYIKSEQKILIQSMDITDSHLLQEKKNEELEKVKMEASTDYLTKLYNRFGLETEIRNYLNINRDSISAFILIDLDNFKAVNDTFGHDKGDECLREVASILKNRFRSSDIIARLGGDEFVIFMKNIKNERIILSNISKLLKELRITYSDGENVVTISASIGIAYIPRDAVDFSGIYKKADEALYYVKNNNKNNYFIYNKKIGEK